MDETAVISNLSSAIQWAVAPVFLLTGVAGFLALLAARMGRAVDRARLIERRVPTIEAEDHKKALYREADVLWNRIRLINWAIRLLVGSALCVCGVIMSMFLGELMSINVGTLVASLFIVAVALIMGGLVFLLIEVSISTRTMRQNVEFLLMESRHP